MAQSLIKCTAVRMFVMPKVFKLGDVVYMTETELKRYRSMVEPEGQEKAGVEVNFADQKPDKQYKRGRRKTQ